MRFINTYTVPIVCQPGTYSTGGAACTDCEPGYYCADPAVTHQACSAGYYSAAKASGCSPCRGGTLCGLTAGIGAACAVGEYVLPLNYATVCNTCPAGKICPSKAGGPETCAAGSMPNANKDSCDPCTAGHSCPSGVDAGSCSSGQYAPAGSAACLPCPDGYYCSAGTSVPAQCGSGRYSNAAGTGCNNCGTGFECPTSRASTRIACEAGKYTSSTTAIICLLTENKYATSTCTTAGYYISGGSCLACPAGSYCPDIFGKFTCPAGTYSEAAKTTCTVCPAGSQCPNVDGTSITVCAAGYYSLPGSTACTPCSIGHYCPQNDRPLEKECDVGYYAPNIGQEICTICPANKNCRDKKTATPCPTHYYAEEGFGECQPCPAGQACNGGATPIDCSPGYYSPEGDKFCHACPPGNYCPAKSSRPSSCGAGKYSSGSGSSSCLPCSAGEYSREGATACITCPAGYYCPATYTLPIRCGHGYYSPAMSVSCTVCTPGYPCTSGSITPAPAEDACPKGFYCPKVTVNGFDVISIVPCSEGTYGNTPGASTQLGACVSCTAGHYCPLKGMISQLPCPKGAYCATPFTIPTLCPAGTYNPKVLGTTLSNCATCPVGNYCPLGSYEPIACPPGYYCAAGSSTYSAANKCAAGSYASTGPTGTSGQCQTCPAGAYCDDSVTPRLCPPGKYNSLTGQSLSSSCLLCSAGKACIKRGNTANDGVPCPPGYYCPAGTEYPTQFPCATGTYSDKVDAIDSTTCATCVQGWYCTLGTNQFTNPMVKCPSGHYCPPGTKSEFEKPCAAGTYLPYIGAVSSSECLYACPPGKYCLAGSAGPSGDCKDGYYCPEGSVVEDQMPCPAGTYSPGTGLKAANECTTCPAGYYCPQASTASTYLACGTGTYNPSTGMQNVAACLTCSAGYFCPSIAGTEQKECGYGKYSAAGATACTTCGATFYCNSPTTTEAAITGLVNACDAGYVCPAGVAEYPAESLLCPAGYFCLLRTVDPTPCPPGKYNPYKGGKSAADCITTPPGKYSYRGSPIPSGDCAAGFYCPAGSTRPIMVPCPVGTFRSKKNGAVVGDCGPCPAGYFCPIGCASPRPCPVGMYCLADAAKPTKCPSGYFGASPLLRSSSQCTACWYGRFCSVGGLTLPDGECDPGYYCTLGSYVPNPTDGVIGNLCPAGGVCPKGSKAAQPCLPGTYSNTAGMKSTSECYTCLAKYYCLGEVKNGVSGDCKAGYYCPAGSKTEKEIAAAPGYYTLTKASIPAECAPGYYNPDSAQSECKECPAGYLCTGTKNTGVFTDCPAGKYCPVHSFVGTDCPAGTYSSVTNLQTAAECTPCPPGRYCVGGLSSTSGPTNAGIYSPSAASSASSGTICPKGSYCPSGSGNPTPCASGTFNPATGSTNSGACQSCTAGKYCGKNGLSAPEGDCDVGYCCPSGSTSPRPDVCSCAKGQYCPAGSSGTTPCPAGTYQDSVKQAACMPCPRGFYCTSGMSTFEGFDCPKGYYCPESTTSATQYPCPVGTYNPITNAIDLSQCMPCTPGHYCTGTARTDADTAPLCAPGYYCVLGAQVSNPSDATGQKCTAGYYCPAGTSYPIPCDPGKACPSAGMSAVGATCTAGYYCTLKATTVTPTSAAQGGGACTPGYYCEAGTIAPVPCPVGTYSNINMQTTLSDCARCDDGYYCDQLAATVKTGKCDAGYYCIKDASMLVGFKTSRPADHICQKGHYCTLGTTIMQPCLSTEYQDLTGQSACKSCPAGYWCTDVAKHYCKPGDEKPSYYCPDGIRAQVPCNDGYYDVQAGSSSVSDCKPCPAGKYCPLVPGAAEEKLNDCPAGRYCVEGTGTTKGVICGAGYYCPAAIAAQMPCPPGKYCETTGLSDTDLATRDCTAGYHCILRSTTPTPTLSVRGVICPAGNFCPAGAKEPIACPPGTYRGLTGGAIPADCTPCTATDYCQSRGLTAPTNDCPAGYYCPTGTAQDKKNPCASGYRCPAGSLAPILCEDNTYQPLPTQSSCTPCPAHFFCKNIDAASAQWPKICPKGQYCKAATQPINCPAGTYNPREGLAAASECEPCPPGMICASAGLSDATVECVAGYYCVRGVSVNPPPGDSTGGVCTKGHYCPVKTISPIACPPGTVNDVTQGTASSACSKCPARYYCPYRGMTSADYSIGIPAVTTFYCNPGYLCLTGSVSPTPNDLTTGRKCAVGKYCVLGALVEQDCAAGTYNPYEGQGCCISCPIGRLCASPGMSTYSQCPVAVYCPGGAAVGTPCPAGTYNPNTDIDSAAQCYPCDPGKYCLGGNSVVDGTCDAGYVCFRSAKAKTSATVFVPNGNTEGLCPKGSYCLAGSKAPIPCEPGTYQDVVGQSVCKACPVGRYCDTSGIIDPSANLCAAGFLCVTGSATPSPYLDVNGGHQCSAGKYCPAGTTAELPCPDGTYEPRIGSSACQTCPAGYYCTVGVTDPALCTIKHYCPSGTSVPIVCLEGTYSKIVGIQRADQCRPCPSGHYCTGGSLGGVCDPGYYCEAGASSPNDASMLCPVGHYCTIGCLTPTVCEEGKVRSTTGAKAASECTDCGAGYYCVSGVSTPFDCPKGYFCPAKSQAPTPCPAGTYSSLTFRTIEDDCLDCPPGYNCSSKATADLSQYLCPVGHYCADSSLEPVKCPNGTFANITGMKAESECYICLYGFYCLEGTVTPKICLEGTHCPAGSSHSSDCPAGFYCKYSEYQGRTISYPQKCLPGYYCPVKTIFPIKCDNGYYCPSGSSTPTPCPSGTMGNHNETNYELSTSCNTCPPGTYSERTSATTGVCKTCLAGYVCVSNTSSKNPVDPEKDGGYVCPKGFYCPEGSYEPTPCPMGRFGNHSGAINVSACMICEEESYNNLEGQPGCKPCGPTSTSGFEATTCKCLGENRVFQWADGKCVCKQYFTSVLENDEDDSQYDCRPLLQQGCASGYLRDTVGNCVAEDSCNKECKGGKGKRTAGVGMCECAAITDPKDVCNSTCRKATPQITVNSKGQFVFPNSTTINTTALKIAGEPACYLGDCKLVSLSMTSGGFSANYQASTKLLTAYAKQRLLGDEETKRLLSAAESTTGIVNPAICINRGDTVTFDISASSYPVYLKDAMANSNPSFDCSAFSELPKKISEGETIEMFIYTFIQAGTYVFADSADLSQQTIIAVMNESDSCPDTEEYIVPVTASNLIKMGVIQNEDITLSPDWVFIGCSLIAILVLFPGVVVLITYLHNKSWRERTLARIAFKRPDSTTKPDPKANSKRAVETSNRAATEESPMMTSKSVIQITKERNESEVDPHIFEEIYRELKQHSEYVKAEFEKKTGQDSANIAMVWAAMRQLKRLVKEKLMAIAQIFGKDIKYMLSSPKKPGEDEVPEAQDQVQDILSMLRGKDNSPSEGENFQPEDDDGIEEAEEKERLDEAVRTRTLKDAADMEKYKEDVEKLNKDFMNSYVEMQNKRLENFKEGVLENSTLTEGDKRELLKEYEKQLQRLQKQLLLDQQDIQPHLLQRLEARRNKRTGLAKQKDEIDSTKQGIKAEHREKLNQILNSLEMNKRKVDEGIDAEIHAKEAEIEAARAENQTKLKAKFDGMLKRTSDSQKRTEVLEMFEKATRDLERIYEEDQKKQLDDFKAQLERRRKDRHGELKAQADSDRKLVQQQKDARLSQILEAETLLNNQLANTAIDEKLLEVCEADQQKQREEEAGVDKIMDQRNEELGKAWAAEKERLAAIKEACSVEEEKMKAGNEVQKRLLAHKTKKKCEELNKKKEALLAKLGEPGINEDRKNRIKAELQRIEEEIQKKIAEELQRQEEEFQKALSEKRRQRASKEEEARSLALSTRSRIEEINGEKLWEERRKIRTERYRRMMEELKPRMAEAELPVAIEKLIDQSHIEELSELLSRQYQEKSKALSRRMGDLIEEKLIQAHKIKEGLLSQLEKLKEAKDNGTLPPIDYERRLKELQTRENDELRDLELSYITKQNDLEEQLYRAQSAKNEEELIRLKEQQQREKAAILQNLSLTNRHAQAMLSNPAGEMEEYKKQLAEEHDKRLRDLEKKKQRLQTIAMENEDKIKAFNSETQKLVEEWNAKESERLMKRKHELEEARKRQEEELKGRSGLSEEERQRIMAEYNAELNALISAMENEQKRQAALTMDKLEKRTGDKEKLKLQKQIQLALYNKEVEENIEERIKRTAIHLGARVEVKDAKEKLNALVSAGEAKKSVFYKKKPLEGVDNLEELEKIQEIVFIEGDQRQKDEEDEFRGTILDIDFDKLMAKIVEMQKKVEAFADGNFNQLIDGFRKINSKLGDLRSKALSKKR